MREGAQGRGYYHGKGEGKSCGGCRKEGSIFEEGPVGSREETSQDGSQARGGIELKLAEVESLNLVHVDEIADLNVALEACENKWYDKGFADAENSVEPIVH